MRRLLQHDVHRIKVICDVRRIRSHMRCTSHMTLNLIKSECRLFAVYRIHVSMRCTSHFACGVLHHHRKQAIKISLFQPQQHQRRMLVVGPVVVPYGCVFVLGVIATSIPLHPTLFLNFSSSRYFRLCTCTWQKYVQCVPCLLYTSPSPRDLSTSRMPSSA